MRAIGLLLTLALAASTGCVDPPSHYGPVQADVLIEENYDFDALWDITLRVLRRANLTPDRQDRREGVITTKPITTQQWFEFWRHDAMGPYQWVESSMHAIQRLALVKISRLPGPGQYRVSVRVDVFRYSAPERQITTPSSALLMYSEKLPTESGELVLPQEVTHWVPLGEDPRMAGVLLRRILVHFPGTYEVVSEPLDADESFEPTDEPEPDEPASEPEAQAAPDQDASPADDEGEPAEEELPGPPAP